MVINRSEREVLEQQLSMSNGKCQQHLSELRKSQCQVEDLLVRQYLSMYTGILLFHQRFEAVYLAYMFSDHNVTASGCKKLHKCRNVVEYYLLKVSIVVVVEN